MAILKGARRITLYGFDLVNGRADPSDTRPEETSRYEQWRREFEILFTECEKRGILVVK